MPQFVPHQSDLFAPAEPPPAKPAGDPIADPAAPRAMPRAADRLPWPDAAATAPHVARAIQLGRQAGPAGEKPASAILGEAERPFAAEE